jgi:hypothetical protein
MNKSPSDIEHLSWLLSEVADEKGMLLNLERIEDVIVRRERQWVYSGAGVGVAEETSAH